MTKTELEQVRALIAKSLAILDAELAKPEALPDAKEWRVLYKILPQSEEWQIPGVFRDEFLMQRAFDSLGDCFMRRIEYRRPAGPWERAE